MSYYENRIKELEHRIEQMARANRLKAIPVEAQLIDRIAELNKENARLKAEVERLRASSFVTAVPVEQYERLVKAGDALADAMDRNGCHDNGDYDENVRVTNDWNAVKEGKQP